MVDWKDPEVLAKCASLFNNLGHVTSGAYGAEVLHTGVYDYEIVTRKRPWKWTMLLYFIAKWFMFFSTIAWLLILGIDYPINCQALYTFVKFAENVSIGSALTLLMIRTFAIFKGSWSVIIPLTILSLGQWAILFHGIVIKSVFVPDVKACVLVSTGEHKNLGLILQSLFSMGFTLTILVLSTIGVLMSGRTSLRKFLFQDGIVYFVIAFSANLIVAVFLLLDLNPIMDVMFTLPAACITASAATRSFIQLNTHLSSDMYDQKHGTDHRPGTDRVYADCEAPMVTWARMPTDVDAGTLDIPRGADPPSDASSGSGLQYYAPEGGTSL